MKDPKIEQGPHCYEQRNPQHQKAVEGLQMQDNDNIESRDGYVYFIATKNRQFVKIGFSVSVTRRLSDLTIGPSEHEMRLVGSFPGTLATERWLHERFKSYRDQGEWFKYAGNLRIFIRGFGFGGFAAEAVDDEPLPANERAIRKIANSEARRCLEAMMVSAVPEFRSRIASEHIKAGFAKKRQRGERIGRPFKLADIGEVWRLRNSGIGATEIARKLGISRTTVHSYLRASRNAAEGATAVACVAVSEKT